MSVQLFSDKLLQSLKFEYLLAKASGMLATRFNFLLGRLPHAQCERLLKRTPSFRDKTVSRLNATALIERKFQFANGT